jgi:hypothetical protein
MGSTLGKVFIPLCGISHGMQGTVENTNQDYVNQTREKADGPGFNGPAPAPQGGQAGQSQIDKRVIKAIINVIKRKRKFAFLYGDVMDELEKLIPNEDEYVELMTRTILDIMFGSIKYLRTISMSDWGDEDIIAALPFEPDDEQMAILELLAEHDTTRYYRTDLDEFHLDPANMRKRVLETIDTAIRKWSKRKPADVAKMLAEEYGVEV